MGPSSEIENKLRLIARGFGTQQSSDFDLNPEFRPKARALRDAAVLMALQNRNDAWHVILTKRNSKLRYHPGQIAFAGGKVDTEDPSRLAAALREAREEIGLLQDDAEVIAEMPAHETVTGFSMYPFIALVSRDFRPRAQPGEVEEVFSVPLDHVCRAANFQVHSRQWLEVKRHYYTIPYGPYYIWGATARVLYAFAQRFESLS